MAYPRIIIYLLRMALVTLRKVSYTLEQLKMSIEGPWSLFNGTSGY